MVAPAVPLIEEDFHSSSTTFPTFVISVFVLGFAGGPLLLAPLSELYGRVVIYNVTNVLFVGFTILCAISTNEAMLLAFRCLSGFAGVATITIGPGTIADIMPREKRGRAVSIWAVGTVVGPMVGPIIGGYVTERAGWRWMFWALSIATGVVAIFAFAFLRESYPPVLLERKAAGLRKQTGDTRYRSKLTSDVKFQQILIQTIIRPSKMLIFCPIVTIMSIYIAIVYGIMYLFFATFSLAFSEVYGYSTFASGLVFIASGAGTLSGLLYLGYFSDRSLKKRTDNGKIAQPEDRLPFVVAVPGALFFSIGIFLYGWSIEEHLQWIIPQIGMALTGFGYILIFTGIQTYLIDAFEEYSASVVGATAILRGVTGALVPLSGLGLYHELGWGWGNSLLGFVAFVLAPLPWIFGRYGAKIRESNTFQLTL